MNWKPWQTVFWRRPNSIDELLERSKEQVLSLSEKAALDGLLRKVDHLTILKARAKLTLRQLPAEASTA